MDLHRSPVRADGLVSQLGIRRQGRSVSTLTAQRVPSRQLGKILLFGPCHFTAGNIYCTLSSGVGRRRLGTAARSVPRVAHLTDSSLDGAKSNEMNPAAAFAASRRYGDFEVRKNSAKRSFTEKLRDRMKHRFETERWKILMRQRSVIDEYARILEELRTSDLQFKRLEDEMPPPDICPACHYCHGFAITLLPLDSDDRAGDAILQCPNCELIVSPE